MQYVPAWGIVRLEVKVSQQYKIVWHVDVLGIKVWKWKSFEKYSDIESMLFTQGNTVQTNRWHGPLFSDKRSFEAVVDLLQYGAQRKFNRRSDTTTPLTGEVIPPPY